MQVCSIPQVIKHVMWQNLKVKYMTYFKASLNIINHVCQLSRDLANTLHYLQLLLPINERFAETKNYQLEVCLFGIYKASCAHEQKAHACICLCKVGTVDRCGYNGQLKYTICDVYRPCHSILSILNRVFHQLRFVVLTDQSGAQMSRYSDFGGDNRWIDGQTDRQTDKPIALPLRMAQGKYWRLSQGRQTLLVGMARTLPLYVIHYKRSKVSAHSLLHGRNSWLICYPDITRTI